MKEITFNVTGMMCTGCENRIQNAVKSIDGVEKVIADHKKGTVTVSVDNDSLESKIKDKIVDLGFEIL